MLSATIGTFVATGILTSTVGQLSPQGKVVVSVNVSVVNSSSFSMLQLTKSVVKANKWKIFFI
jgi:hypothetical protein